MFSQFFGNYLLENDLITNEELMEVLDIQEETRVRLGVLAVNMGYMDATAIEKVHAKQAVEDKMFGEIAVEMGFLSEKELEKVLSMQKKEHHLMAQTLIDKDIMTLQELEEAYKGYKKENELSEEEFAALKENNVEKIVDAFLDFGNVEDSHFYKDYTVLLIKNLIRFISSKLRIKGLRESQEYNSSWGAYQQVEGDKKLFTAAVAEEDEFVVFAERYSEMELDGPGELAQDSVAEFINLQNGIFLVNCSDEGIKLEMQPQGSLQNNEIKFKERAYVISLELEFGDVDFIIANEVPDIS